MIGNAVTNLATTVGTLQAVGAQHILVVNFPDLGLTTARSLLLQLSASDSLSSDQAADRRTRPRLFVRFRGTQSLSGLSAVASMDQQK